ncbi:hypothetical protein D9756_008893 [Leucocoprinus leucothites]|uniref:DNA repair protein rhp7 treble clef domain-containing protein n=1 Tax=Leucocoprinus leucothites TaxID=201217 RepID=A0A8H5CZ33_9AGAR|nr:hypothetical protein D9756_008893 [Leucoagaricus leucothites]
MVTVSRSMIISERMARQSACRDMDMTESLQLPMEKNIAGSWMVRNDGRRTRVVEYKEYVPTIGPFKGQPGSLVIDGSCLSILDEIILTFIYCEKLWTDRRVAAEECIPTMLLDCSSHIVCTGAGAADPLISVTPSDFGLESGINATSIARRAQTRNARNQQQGQDQPVEDPSNQAETENAEAGPSTPSSSRSRRRSIRTRSNLRYSGNNSDDLDNSEPEEEAIPTTPQAETQSTTQTNGKKRKLTKAAEAKLKAKEKKKRGIKDSDEDDMDEDDDAYTAPSRLMKDATGAKPAPGSFETCIKCKERFTVTVYTMAAVPGPGWLCHPCAKATGNDPFKKPQASKKKKAPADKRVVTSFEERRFPSLVSVCVQLITKYIDDVESLGDIGSLNVDAISKALSKNRICCFKSARGGRGLNPLSDLAPDAFQTLAYLNPNLTSLRLDFCGQINDSAFNTLSASLPALTSLELLGPFLVKPPAWQNFFKSHPNLEKLLITQSPRFDLECLQTLVSSCGPTLRVLRLKEIGKLDDEFLQELSTLRGDESQLTHLDLSDPGESCGEKAMIDLLSAIGEHLTYFNVSNHILLTDNFLLEGLLSHTKALDTLVLNNLPELTDQGVGSFFSSWDNNTPLVRLDLSRNHLLADQAMEAILDHSGEKLEELNINGWKSLGEDMLITLAVKAPELRKVDVGWVREMSDFVVKAWVDGAPEGAIEKQDNPDAMAVDTVVPRVGGCKKLEEVKVWGCNRITLNCPRKRGMNIYGVEAHTVIRTSA